MTILYFNMFISKHIVFVSVSCLTILVHLRNKEQITSKIKIYNSLWFQLTLIPHSDTYVLNI